MKNNSNRLAVKMLIAMVAGIAVGLGFMLLREKLGGGRDNFSTKLGQMLITFALVCFSWVFFRANGTREAFVLIGAMFSEFNPWVFTDGTLFSLGLDAADMFVLFSALLVLLLVSVARYNNVRIRSWLAEQGLWFRYTVYLTAIFAVMIFGIYGAQFDAAQFIYFQF